MLFDCLMLGMLFALVAIPGDTSPNNVQYAPRAVLLKVKQSVLHCPILLHPLVDHVSAENKTGASPANK